MSVVQLKPETTRKPGPYPADRKCEGCGAKLSRSNPGTACAPCLGGEWKSPDPTTAQIEQLRRDRLDELGAAA